MKRKTKRGSVLVFKLFFIFISGLGFANPSVSKSKDNSSMMGKDIRSLIQKEHSDFKMLPKSAFSKEALIASSNHPNAIFGDFNGDKLPDMAFFGYSLKANKSFIYVALSNKDSRSFELNKLLEATLTKVNPLKDFKSFLSVGKKGDVLKAQRDLIQIETMDSPHFHVTPYYYSLKEKKILRFTGQWN